MKSKRASTDVLILKNKIDVSGEYTRFRRIWQKGLLNSEEIIHMADLKIGPKIGEVIEKIKKAQFEGLIRSRKEAINFILNSYKQ
jgi:hypothetical protein